MPSDCNGKAPFENLETASIIPKALLKPTKVDAEIPTFNYQYQDVPEDLKHLPDRVSDSFIGKTVFITGGSGFLGKVLIEKLLRRCPNIGRIYLLMRPKKGMEPSERLKNLFSSPLYSLLKEKQGEKFFKKLSVISGDVAEIDLGISPEDRALLCDTVNIVFHIAATVRFDEPLRKAVVINTRGTKFMLDLARQMKQLEVFTHVSTAYCQPEVKIIEEKTYQPPYDPHKMIQLCNLLKEDEMECIKNKILKKYPNTYAFSKSLSEGLLYEAIEEGLPCLIVRPSIVIPTWMEPIPGWTDNTNGPTGLLLAAGKGILRTIYMKSDGYADFIPVDLCVSAMILASFYFQYLGDSNRIYNFTTSSEWQVTWQEIIDMGKDIVSTTIPLPGCVWYPGGSMKSNKLWHNICVILFHMIPAYILDGMIYLSGNRPVLVYVQNRINQGFEIFEYYANNQWHFLNDQMSKLPEELNDRERYEYKTRGENLTVRKYFEDGALGGRLYLLKADPATIPSDRIHMRILYWVDVIVKVLLTILLIWFVYNYIGSFVKFFVSIYQLILHIISFFTQSSSAPSSLPMNL